MTWLKGVFCVLGGLVAGFLVGHFSRAFLSLDLKKEVSVADIFNFLTAVVIALLLQNIVQKRYSNERIEKDLLIENIKEVILVFKDTRTLFISVYNMKRIPLDDSKAIMGLLRNLANSLRSLEVCLKECSIEVETTRLEELKRLYFEYKRILTGGTFPSKPYSGEIFNEEETIYSELYSKLQLLIFNVNRK
jgi:hypothetical protein